MIWFPAATRKCKARERTTPSLGIKCQRICTILSVLEADYELESQSKQLN